MRDITEMPYLIGIKIRIYPSQTQMQIISKNSGASRFIYNRLVARDRELYALRKVNIYCRPVADRIAYLESLGMKSSDLKAAYPFLEDGDIDAQMIANAIKNYRTAWNNFRTVPGTGIPVFHKKGYEESYQTNAHYYKDASLITQGNIHLDEKRHITLPKLGSVRFKGSDRIFKVFGRKCETRIGAVCISRNAVGEYYVSFQIGSVYPFHKRMRPLKSSVGIDMNVENFCTLSDGRVIENPRPRKNLQKKLAKAQKKLSRRAERAKKEGRSLRMSKNYQRQRMKVAKLHLAACRSREAFQHRVSKKIVESQGAVFVENLKTKNLMKNHSLAFAISDVAWGRFFHMLEYKSGLYGRIFLKIPARDTTQTCSRCGHIMSGEEKITLEIREWNCPVCGTHHLRDHNAAVNIRNRGLALLAQAV